MAAVDPQLAAERAVSLPALLTSRECRRRGSRHGWRSTSARCWC